MISTAPGHDLLDFFEPGNEPGSKNPLGHSKYRHVPTSSIAEC